MGQWECVSGGKRKGRTRAKRARKEIDLGTLVLASKSLASLNLESCWESKDEKVSGWGCG